MTLQQMNYLLTIAESGSMNKAAEKLFIAQPTLTGVVRDVESEIGISVFHRTPKGVIPTAEGEDFLVRIRKVYQQYEEVLKTYEKGGKIRRKFAVSMQHYSFAVKAFIEMAKHYDSSQFDLVLRETKTADVIKDVSSLKSEIGIIFICEINQKMIGKILRDNDLEFTPLIKCPAKVYLSKEHPLASEKELTFEQLEPYPCMSFEQGSEAEIYYAEEMHIEHAYQKTVKATDRATIMNLMAGLNGYTLCSSIFSDDLSGGQFIMIPYKTENNSENTMTIGCITKKNWELSSMGQQFLDEIHNELRSV